MDELPYIIAMPAKNRLTLNEYCQLTKLPNHIRYHELNKAKQKPAR